MYILNDTHIGTHRVAGTTPETQKQLRQYLLDNFNKCLQRCDDDLCILGDLFDTYQIPLTDMVATSKMLAAWLRKGGHKLWLVPGNHDLSTDNSKLSSFQAMAALLEEYFPSQVSYVGEAALLQDGIYAVPHVTNQDIFDAELAKVPDCDWLLVHCNYDNNFAAQSDHSLNLSAEVAAKLPAKHIFFAHEHQGRTAMDGKVVIAGNQFPSSISDCLGERQKFMHKLGDEAFQLETWNSEQYVEMPWDALEATDAPFVRIVGACDPVQAAEMTDAVARYRRTSKSLIVGNAVRIGEDGEVSEAAAMSLEKLQAFDVVGVLREILSPEQMKVVESIDA